VRNSFTSPLWLINNCTGVFGLGPYLAPEIFHDKPYDPRCVDVWSHTIIYCCMILGRFPWKVAHPTDRSFNLFAVQVTLKTSPECMTQKGSSALFGLKRYPKPSAEGSTHQRPSDASIQRHRDLNPENVSATSLSEAA
jgi:serine/threonine protein kinase